MRPRCRRRFAASLGLALAFGVPQLPAQTPRQPARGEISAEFVHATVDSLASVVRDEYVDAEVATRVEGSLRKWLAEGRYADVRTPEDLSRSLTRDLVALTSDKHLAVVVDRESPSAIAGETVSAEPRLTAARRSNFGVQRVEILPGNVGYINIRSFYRPDEAREAISAAMQVLSNADALIVDLRGDGGGSPDTVALFASYLFETPGLKLFEIASRSGDVRPYRTETSPLPNRNERRSVYVLTDARTFSAGEGLAYILQERRRAEIVGEATAGAANPGRPYRLNSDLQVTIPTGKVRSAVRGANWEGTGVMPDVAAPSNDALRVAHVRALRQLIEQASRGPWRDLLEGQLALLDRETLR